MAGHVVVLGADGPPARVDALVGGEVLGDDRTGERVEHAQLLRPRPQPQLVGLPVHRDEVLGDLREHPDGGAAAPDVGPAAPARGQRPREQQLPLVQLPAGLPGAGGDRTVLGHLQPALDDGALVARAHRPGVGALTHEQPRPVTTIVLPAPVSPVMTVSPGPAAAGRRG